MSNPYTLTMRPQYMGLDIVETSTAESVEQDWSGCRSPSRAKRRHARGIRTRMTEKRTPAAFRFGNKLYVHPRIAAELRNAFARDMKSAIDKRMLDALNGTVEAARESIKTPLLTMQVMRSRKLGVIIDGT